MSGRRALQGEMKTVRRPCFGLLTPMERAQAALALRVPFFALDWAAGVQGRGGTGELRRGTALGISGRPRQCGVPAGAIPPGKLR